MTSELIKFGVVILVVMLGFVMSLLAPFMDVETFAQTWLTLVKAMLGEVGLLNLLIAVLSTAHSKVEENAEREFKVSKGCVIQHYGMTVQKELLPVPLSVARLALS